MTLAKTMLAETLFYLKNKGGKIKKVVIPKIPNTWEFFLDTEDLWIGVNYPEESNLTGCLYKGGLNPNEKSIFYGHLHEFNSEGFTIVNKNGHVVVYTKTYKRVLKYGESIWFDKGEAHLVEFLKPTILNVIWQPKMVKFNLEFINNTEEE